MHQLQRDNSILSHNHDAVQFSSGIDILHTSSSSLIIIRKGYPRSHSFLSLTDITNNWRVRCSFDPFSCLCIQA